MIAAQHEPVRVSAPCSGAQSALLTDEAKRFLILLARTFETEREELLDRREARRRAFEHGKLPGFPIETAHIRGNQWTVATPRADLLDRRVELVGAPTREAVQTALHSGASVFVADLADSTSPTWDNLLSAQANLRDAVRGLAGMQEPAPAFMLRPRSWHIDERRFTVDGRPIPAALFDYGLYLFHNAKTLLAEGSAPYFSLPCVDGYWEAHLWNDLFLTAEDALRISRGVIRAEVPIETVTAAFEMDEILWELRQHSAGLVCAPWGYAASIASAFANRPEFILPERSRLTTDQRFLNAYANLIVHTCHRRRTHAIGATALRVSPSREVRGDQLREVWAGYDGTRVAHPDLVLPARDVFDTYMPFPNQIERQFDLEVTAADLLGMGAQDGFPATAIPRRDQREWFGGTERNSTLGEPAVPGTEISEAGLRWTVEAGLECLSAWLAGGGTTVVDGSVENGCTAELCCAQLRQWIRNGAVTVSMVREILGRHSSSEAARLFEDATTGANCGTSILSRATALLD